MKAPIDWALARRMSAGIASLEAPGRGPATLPIDADWMRETSREVEPLVVAATGLEPRRELPGGELISRAEWIDVALVSLKDATALVEEGLAETSVGETSGGPGFLRPVVGAVAAAEIAAALGLIARKVLGQYDIALVGPERPPRLLYVEPNLLGSISELGFERAHFLRWVALHEVTHAVQFSSVPWLREHLSQMVSELIAGTSRHVGGEGGASVLSKLASAPRETARAALRGELVNALAGPENAALLDPIQATMAVVEGHAEWTMDVADEQGEFASLREGLESRRDRGGLAANVLRLLGFEQKLRQYRLGRAFCLAVVDHAGPDALRAVWDRPENLPTLTELEAPRDWCDRVVGVGSGA
ncbi:hypothetical protein HJD18_16000 [Thermoleophilia bacterium SCSIO 60948]|nr:hypothetical protein HJD18_16000 [Thermoleophilia bacterium SCSIO 60948]